MASRSRSNTPHATPISMEGEPTETDITEQHDDFDVSDRTTSLLPVVDLSNDFDRTTHNKHSSYQGQIASSLSKTAPSIQSVLGKRYLPSNHQSQSLLQTNPQSLRRNPVRLARPTFSTEISQRRRRSTSSNQESMSNKHRSLSPASADDDLPPLSFEKEREKRVVFPSVNHDSLIFERSPSPLHRSSHRVEFPSTSSGVNRRSEALPRSRGYETQRKEEAERGDNMQISKDFMKQLCQAFKVENLDQLQRVLPYQPSAPQPLLSQTKQQTYYENNLSYTAAASEDSASEISTDGELSHQQISTRSQVSRSRSIPNADIRALLSQRERPLRGKWVPPAHIPQLDESIEDYDLWFHQMHQYLLQSCITNPADQRFLTQLHCDWDFFEAIVTRAKGMNIPKETLCGSRRIFRNFVCTYYTRPEALREVQDELRNLGRKDLSAKEAWQELRRLFLSHDAKAKRQGYPELTDQQKVEYLIDSLRPRVQFLMSWLRRQRHPDLATPSTAYAAALLCEKDLQKLDSIGQETSSDLAWFTSANMREQVRLPILSQQAKTQALSREITPKSERASRPVSLLPSQQRNPQLIERTSQVNSYTSSVNRQKRASDDHSQREKMLCAFCLNKGHTALDCRKRRRALEFQLRGRAGHQQRAQEPKRDIAMTAPDALSQSLSSRQHFQVQSTPSNQYPQRRSGLTQRPTFRPTCDFCHKLGHDESKCWNKYPHLKPKFPRQPGATPLQGRARREANSIADKHLPVEEVQQVSLNPWRDSSTSQHHLASLVLASPQSFSDQRTAETRNNIDWENQIHKVRRQNLCRCLPTLRAIANNQILHIIIDTGATINLMNIHIAKAMHTRAATEPISVSDISGNSQRLSELVTVPLELSGYPYVFRLLCNSNLTWRCSPRYGCYSRSRVNCQSN